MYPPEVEEEIVTHPAIGEVAGLGMSDTASGERAGGIAFTCTLEAGLRVVEAARRGFAAEGFAGGTLNINGGALGPFAYVMPALSRNGENAAFYSGTFRPADTTRLKIGTMTLGQRDGAPFFHCHALWTEADGRAGGGPVPP